MGKLNEFNDLILMNYKQKNTQLKIIAQLNKTRTIMERYDFFAKLSAKIQFEVCTTICLIAIQTSRKDLDKVKLSGREPIEDFEYSIN
jgi:hypothetical protein